MGIEPKTGWERENRTHFDEIVAQYDKIRPVYPGALFADMFDYVGPDNTGKALEIGAGTGRATVFVLDAGYAVTAVEPGENMAAFLQDRLGGTSGLNIIVAAFEDAPLEDESCDLIYAGSAFHWVDAEIGCPKAFRLLKRGILVSIKAHNQQGVGAVQPYRFFRRAPYF